MAEGNDADEGQDDLAWVEDVSCQDFDDGVEESSVSNFQFTTQVCFLCEGYYGPSFGQHVCNTCHIFLFPDNINLPLEINLSEVNSLDKLPHNHPAHYGFTFSANLMTRTLVTTSRQTWL